VDGVSDTPPHDGPATPPPPPPPPPPDLKPPSFPAHEGAPHAASGLKRVGGLARSTVILVGITGVTTVFSTLTSGLARDEARAFLDGRISEDEFIEAYSPGALFGLVQFLTFIGAGVLTILLMFRLASNHRALGRSGTWAPGWAIGGWFLPPLVLYVIPFLMLRELWKASDPSIPPGDDRWRASPVAPVVTVWWLLYGLAPLALLVIQGFGAVGSNLTAGSTEAAAEVLVDQFAFSVVGAVVTVLGAISFIVLVRGLAARHRQLTGEYTAP
jgi:hypothetical protein